MKYQSVNWVSIRFGTAAAGENAWRFNCKRQILSWVESFSTYFRWQLGGCCATDEKDQENAHRTFSQTSRFASLRWLRKQRNRYREKGHHEKIDLEAFGNEIKNRPNLLNQISIDFFLLAVVTKESAWLMISFQTTGPRWIRASMLINWIENLMEHRPPLRARWPHNNTMIDPLEQTRFIIRHIVPDSKSLRREFSLRHLQLRDLHRSHPGILSVSRV